ncbi:MAG: diacylglycerol kinase family lipid kinase [Candidatus Aminicenantes bacterium]|nr:diacylglycerol kinase family lipid kinase [Candidatus Aminicenantes bacterium]
MLLKTQVIINPESNQGRTKKRWEHIREALKFFIKEFKFEFTEKPNQAAEISRAAIKDGTELIVGVGGDGTMNEIANGFFENEKPINPETTLGIVPSGTGSDFCRSLNIPFGLKNALQVITQSPSNMIDIGRVKFRNHSDFDEERLFLNVSDFGIGGEVVHRMNQDKLKKKASSYFRSLVTTFMSYKHKNLRIKIDDEDIPLQEYMIGAISNGRIFGKGMKIAPTASLNDGLFDLVLVKGMKKFEFFRNVYKIYTGTHLSHPKISHMRGSQIEVTPADFKEKVLIEVDGEQVGSLPALFEIIPASLLVKSNL